jgi:hypothetical protein
MPRQSPCRDAPAAAGRHRCLLRLSGTNPVLALNRPLFRSQTVATPGAVEWLQQAALDAALLPSRHENGDWGDLEEEDSATNQAVYWSDGTQSLACWEMLRNGHRFWGDLWRDAGGQPSDPRALSLWAINRLCRMCWLALASLLHVGLMLR